MECQSFAYKCNLSPNLDWNANDDKAYDHNQDTCDTCGKFTRSVLDKLPK